MRKNIPLIIVIILNIWLCLIILSNRNISEPLTTQNLSSSRYYEDEITEGFLNTIKYEHMAFQISENANNIFDEVFNIDNSTVLAP